MAVRNNLKKIKRTFAFWGLWFFSLIIRFLPAGWVGGFAKVAAVLGYCIAVKQRKIARESLSIAFGGKKSPGEIKKIARQCFYYLAKNVLEFMVLIENPHLIKDKVRFEGKEHLDACLAKGNGVILLTAHFGNFPLMMVALGQQGYRVSGIMRRMRDERAEKLFSRRRKEIGINAIHAQPRKVCVENSLKVLRNNEVLVIQLDQNFGTGGVFVDFFGQKAATATGPVVLARRTKAAILPCFVVHGSDNKYRIIFEPEYKLKEAASHEETLLVSIQELTSMIESYVRKYPAEWGWIHRRWKSRPNEKN